MMENYNTKILILIQSSHFSRTRSIKINSTAHEQYFTVPLKYALVWYVTYICIRHATFCSTVLFKINYMRPTKRTQLVTSNFSRK